MSVVKQSVMGFVPKNEVKTFQPFTVGENTAKIYKFGAVQLSGGLAIPAAITGNVLGIAVHHVDATGAGETKDIAVMVDADAVYEVAADEAFAQSDVGKYVSMVSNGGVGDRSSAIAKLSTANLTATTNTPFIVVGPSRTTADASTPVFILVKLANPVLDYRGLDAT